jgi:serine/threonine protein kinase
MAVPKTTDDVLTRLAESQLLTPMCLEKIRSQLPADSAETPPRDLLSALVRQRVVTPFQARRLLAGYTDGFFVGKYRILELLGAGGMGKVYLAEQTTMKRPVALKLLPTRHSEEHSSLARFTREARAAAKLRHPNITQAYDFDQVGKMAFIAMEYIEGLDLQELVKHHRKVPWSLAAHLIAQAACGLEHAHQHGLVHRDIKPSNLMVEPDGTVKLLDLGLVTDAAGDSSLTLAEKDVVLGTADYISPEQAINSHQVDIRSDIYSLGGVLYFLLTGQSPFPDKSVPQKLLMHQMEEPTPVRDLEPAVPPELSSVVERMMAKKPEARFAKPQLVAEELKPLAKPDRPYDPSLIRFPRQVVDQYLRFGGEGPSSSAKMGKPQALLTPRIDGNAGVPPYPPGPSPEAVMATTPEPRGKAGKGNRTPAQADVEPVAPSARAEGLHPHEGRNRGRRGKAGRDGTRGNSSRRHRENEDSLDIPFPSLEKSNLPLYIGGSALFILLAAGVGTVAILWGTATLTPNKPASTVAQGSAPLGRVTNLGPGARSMPIAAALDRAPARGTIFLKHKPEGWRPRTLVIRRGQLGNNGHLTLAGKGGKVVLRRQRQNPIFRISNVDGFTLRNLILDGDNRSGPLIEIEGSVAGVTLEDLTIRNVKGEAIRFLSVHGQPKRPVRILSNKFLGRSTLAMAFHGRNTDGRSQHVEILGCQTTGGAGGVLFAQPVESVSVRDCTFAGSTYGIQFISHYTLQDESKIEPVKDWRVAGWWPRDQVPRFDPTRPPPNGAAFPGVPGVLWHKAEVDSGYIDLTKLLGNREDVEALAYGTFRTFRPGPRPLFVGVDDQVTLWVNGQQVLDHKGNQPYRERELHAVAQLRRGVNHIWARVGNGISESALSVHVARDYIPLTPAQWRQVTVSNNNFEGGSQGILFFNPPQAGSKIEVSGNRFNKIRHYPILVRKSSEPFRKETVQPFRNSDQNQNQEERTYFNDGTAYELVPLGQ